MDDILKYCKTIFNKNLKKESTIANAQAILNVTEQGV
jgi:hypothetical protein